MIIFVFINFQTKIIAMKSKYRFTFIFLFLVFFVLLTESCYTKKKGIVPCPTWGQVEQNQNMSVNLTVKSSE